VASVFIGHAIEIVVNIHGNTDQTAQYQTEHSFSSGFKNYAVPCSEDTSKQGLTIFFGNEDCTKPA